MRESNDVDELRRKVIEGGKRSVSELIKVLGEKIIGNKSLMDIDDEGNVISGAIPPEKMKLAAQSKRVAFDDAMSILDSIQKFESRDDDAKEESKPEGFIGKHLGKD